MAAPTGVKGSRCAGMMHPFESLKCWTNAHRRCQGRIQSGGWTAAQWRRTHWQCAQCRWALWQHQGWRCWQGRRASWGRSAVAGPAGIEVKGGSFVHRVGWDACRHRHHVSRCRRRCRRCRPRCCILGCTHGCHAFRQTWQGEGWLAAGSEWRAALWRAVLPRGERRGRQVAGGFDCRAQCKAPAGCQLNVQRYRCAALRRGCCHRLQLLSGWGLHRGAQRAQELGSQAAVTSPALAGGSRWRCCCPSGQAWTGSLEGGGGGSLGGGSRR